VTLPTSRCGAGSSIWRLSNTLDASFCVEALNEDIARYGTPEIMNTDQGSQFTGEHHNQDGGLPASFWKCRFSSPQAV